MRAAVASGAAVLAVLALGASPAAGAEVGPNVSDDACHLGDTRPEHPGPMPRLHRTQRHELHRSGVRAERQRDRLHVAPAGLGRRRAALAACSGLLLLLSESACSAPAPSPGTEEPPRGTRATPRHSGVPIPVEAVRAPPRPPTAVLVGDRTTAVQVAQDWQAMDGDPPRESRVVQWPRSRASRQSAGMLFLGAPSPVRLVVRRYLEVAADGVPEERRGAAVPA